MRKAIPFITAMNLNSISIITECLTIAKSPQQNVPPHILNMLLLHDLFAKNVVAMKTRTGERFIV